MAKVDSAVFFCAELQVTRQRDSRFVNRSAVCVPAALRALLESCCGSPICRGRPIREVELCFGALLFPSDDVIGRSK